MRGQMCVAVNVAAAPQAVSVWLLLEAVAAVVSGRCCC